MAVMREITISPSLICTDLCNIEKDVHNLEAAGVDFLHIDLLDGHFSPSMPMGIEVVQQVRQKTQLPFDVHLMVENNEFFIREMAKIGIQQMCFHYESAFHVDRMLSLIQQNGIRPGIALMPATPLWVLEYCVERIEFVLLMLINPGFAGQKGEAQVRYAERKVADCRRFLSDRGRDIPIEIDGRVSFENIPQLVAAGADILVTGSSSLFHKDGTLSENLERTKRAIALGLEKRRAL
jgi:ribulose-phosphate 3-epimerase